MRKVKLFLALALAASVCVPTVSVSAVDETVVIDDATDRINRYFIISIGTELN